MRKKGKSSVKVIRGQSVLCSSWGVLRSCSSVVDVVDMGEMRPTQQSRHGGRAADWTAKITDAVWWSFKSHRLHVFAQRGIL